MEAKPTSYYLAPTLLVLGTALAAGNWYLRPQRAVVWATVLLLLGCMALALRLVGHRRDDEASARHAADSVRSGIVFAGLTIAFSLSVKLATTLGTAAHSDLSQRVTMAILGAFLVFTGNVIPKTLTPLSALACDPARLQALQRFAGWTWVLTGLAIAVAWLVLPLRLAEPISFVLLPGAILLIVAQLVRLRYARQRPA
jgi:hypothetical protein